MEMTTFWFVTYIILFTIVIVATSRASTRSDHLVVLAEDWLLGIIVGTFMVPLLLLSYHAGLFYHFTGYSGNTLWFAVWLVLVSSSIGANIYKREIVKTLVGLLSILLVYLMNGMTQLGNLL